MIVSTHSVRKQYSAGSALIIDEFDGDGEVVVTFFPKQQSSYLESEEYCNNDIVFTSDSSEQDKQFFNSLQKTDENLVS